MLAILEIESKIFTGHKYDKAVESMTIMSNENNFSNRQG
jgi:hypothetical protein